MPHPLHQLFSANPKMISVCQRQFHTWSTNTDTQLWKINGRTSTLRFFGCCLVSDKWRCFCSCSALCMYSRWSDSSTWCCRCSSSPRSWCRAARCLYSKSRIDSSCLTLVSCSRSSWTCRRSMFYKQHSKIHTVTTLPNTTCTDA